MSAKEDALALITSFESSGKNGMWVNIAPADVAKALRERVEKPEAINQGEVCFAVQQHLPIT